MLNKNQAHGALKEFEGKVQEKIGDIIGNKEQQAKGLQKQAMGKAEKSLGNANEVLEDAKDAVKSSKHPA